MAKVSSYFKCLVCNHVLNFPDDTSIVAFTIAFLTFYRDHDNCERIELSLIKKHEESLKKTQPLTLQDVDAPVEMKT